MTEPRTVLDNRFSNPDAKPTSWAAACAALESAQITWISTVRADGRPHVTPLVAVWLDNTLYFSTGPDEQKAVNLGANPYVVLSTGRNSWDDALDVMVEGPARRVTDRPTLERLAAAWRSKWDGDSWAYDVTDEGFAHGDGDSVQVFAVVPTKILVFGRQRPIGDGPVTFTHTRHRPA